MNRFFLLYLFLSPLMLCAQHQRVSLDFEAVSTEAEALIQQTQPKPPNKLPKALTNLSYDDYRNIRFRPSEALWWNDPLPYRIEFFHLGHIFTQPVQIFEVSDTHMQEVPFLPTAFNYENSGYEPGFWSTPPGYAGIRVKYPLNQKHVYDDLIVFQGASYFRALGQGQAYGLSLRALAMNTLGDHEDFPRFTKLWLKKPQDNNTPLTIYALLEGKKVTGAYKFIIKPNGVTNIDVRARLFFRDGGAAEACIAPITSMFVFGENSNHAFPDWRPEVHDSDGVLIRADDKWTWQPLENIPGRYTRKFPVARLRGFGLMQRDREFENYKDLEANYERRPSAWITPKGKWPHGSVVLYTFGTDSEATDNVTLFWQPDLTSDRTEPIDLEYSISLRLKEPTHALAKVLETRVGQRTLDPNRTTIALEFSRPESIAVDEIPQLDLGIETGNTKLFEKPIIQHNAIQDRIRVFIHLNNEPTEQPLELSAQLLREGHQVSEKWCYTWTP